MVPIWVLWVSVHVECKETVAVRQTQKNIALEASDPWFSPASSVTALHLWWQFLRLRKVANLIIPHLIRWKLGHLATLHSNIWLLLVGIWTRVRFKLGLGALRSTFAMLAWKSRRSSLPYVRASSQYRRYSTQPLQHARPGKWAKSRSVHLHVRS